jgi:hypothetical protein
MTRDEVIKNLSQDMTECADLDTVVDFYFESMQSWLDTLNEEELIHEYEEWFSPDAPIKIEEVDSDQE